MKTVGSHSAVFPFDPQTEWARYLQAGPMDFSPQLVARLEAEFALMKREHPNWIVNEKFLDVHASLDCGCFVSADGYAFTSFTDMRDPDLNTIDDHRFHGRTTALILGSNFIPELLTALPKRPPQAVACASCERIRGESEISPAVRFMYCYYCAGLGWLVPGYDQTPYRPPIASVSLREKLRARLSRGRFIAKLIPGSFSDGGGKGGLT